MILVKEQVTRRWAKIESRARHQWLTTIILATQEAEIRRIEIQSQPEQIVHKTLSQKTLHKIGLADWLKVKALSSKSQ
jgi:hypothetical protein